MCRRLECVVTGRVCGSGKCTTRMQSGCAWFGGGKHNSTGFEASRCLRPRRSVHFASTRAVGRPTQVHRTRPPINAPIADRIRRTMKTRPSAPATMTISINNYRRRTLKCTLRTNNRGPGQVHIPHLGLTSLRRIRLTTSLSNFSEFPDDIVSAGDSAAKFPPSELFCDETTHAHTTNTSSCRMQKRGSSLAQPHQIEQLAGMKDGGADTTTTTTVGVCVSGTGSERVCALTLRSRS